MPAPGLITKIVGDGNSGTFSARMWTPDSGAGTVLYHPAQMLLGSDGNPISSTNGVPTIAAGLISNPAKASITRLANTTAYAVGDILADNATAGSITLYSWTGATITGSGGAGVIDGLAVSKTGPNTLTMRAHFFNATVVPANGDNGVFAITSFDLDKYIGFIDVLVSDLINGGGATGVSQNQGVAFSLASGDTIYALLETLNAYAPTSAEVISLRPKIKRYA